MVEASFGNVSGVTTVCTSGCSCRATSGRASVTGLQPPGQAG